MIRYYIYDNLLFFNEVSKDKFYTVLRFYKSYKVDFTIETKYCYSDGDLVKVKRLLQNSVYYEKNK